MDIFSSHPWSKNTGFGAYLLIPFAIRVWHMPNSEVQIHGIWTLYPSTAGAVPLYLKGTSSRYQIKDLGAHFPLTREEKGTLHINGMGRLLPYE